MASSFAEKLLGKYGWKKGEGLGKDKQGISEPLKVSQNLGNTGLGINSDPEIKKQYFEWWEAIYDKNATTLSSGISISSNERSSDAPVLDLRPAPQFLKAGELPTTSSSAHQSDTLSTLMIKSTVDEVDAAGKKMTDQELFEFCGRRTARKGARGIQIESDDDESDAEFRRKRLELVQKLKSKKSEKKQKDKPEKKEKEKREKREKKEKKEKRKSKDKIKKIKLKSE